MRHLRRVAALQLAGLLTVVCLSAPRSCSAEESALPPWLSEITLNGFFESSYSYNFNRPDSRTNQFRVFDFDDDTFKLDVFELVVQRAVSKPRDAGVRLDVTIGSSVPRVAASAGLFRDDAGNAEDVDIHQAFGSYLAPMGSGLRLDLGKFVTSAGAEVIQGYDGWNDNATRSVLFGYAIPFTHVGARATYAFTAKVSAQVMLVNGWDVARDNNRSKTVGAELTLAPTSSFSVLVTGMSGAERPSSTDPRRLLDVVAILRPTNKLSFGINADWATEKGATAAGQDASWSGVAGYTRLEVGGPWVVSLRAECFEDPDGVRTGTPQYLTEYTVTPELRLSPHLLVRADARLDQSNRAVFEKQDHLVDSQPTVLFDLSYSF